MFPRHEGLRCLELGLPGPSADRLVSLVLHGSKRATAGLLAEYDVEGEELEHVGEVQWLLMPDGTPARRIRITRIDVVPFAEVTWEFAQAEGEGFVDIEDWRAQHLDFWRRAAEADGTTPPVHDDTSVVCLWFDLL